MDSLAPASSAGRHENWPGTVSALVGPRVHLEVPPVRESALSWDLPKEDAEHLSSLMAAADISHCD